MKFYLLTTALILVSLSQINTDSVCTAQVLITELSQDILDNGKLDCLRKPLPPPRDKPEGPTDRKKRLEAAWDSDCAFEADYDWLKVVRDRYGMRQGLVDRDGKAVEAPFDDQADICELIRAMIVGGIFEGQKLDGLSEDSFQSIDCPGPADQNLQICAATGGAASQKYSWLILLEPSSLTIADSTIRPQWQLEPKSAAKIEARKTQTS